MARGFTVVGLSILKLVVQFSVSAVACMPSTLSLSLLKIQALTIGNMFKND
jgi:hypothetical protein